MAPDTDNKPEANDEFKASETTPDQPDSSSVNTDNTEEINKISEEQTSPKPEPVINNEPTSLKPDNNEKPNHHGFKPELILWPSLRARLGSRARPIASFVIILVIIILGAVSYGLTKNKTDKPILASSFKAPVKTFQLVSTVPGKNATNVNAASQLTLNFNLPVNATKLTNNMFITPTLNGVFKQGSNPDQVVFQPSTPLNKG
ncbi:MAG TPA: Ig-like domain-containing protein, partial [Candidatus Saccharimonadales bacterium]|nr:Ig-like domain-containing protein [Candidatus Saccharimonadales bacterium]